LASELRWILLAIGLPVLAAIWWWTSRRSRQATDNPELREVSQPTERPEEPMHAVVRDEPGDWGVPPFEPLSIRTADFDALQADHPLMTAHPAPLKEQGTLVEAVSAEPVVSNPPASAPPSSAAAHSETASTGNRPQLPNAAETQRIVTLRVCALDETRWSGMTLLAALNDHGLAHGRYQVFHRKHSDGRTLFCAASLVEPGTFNLAQMPAEEYRGLTLFAVLPGPIDAVQTVDALIDTADALARTLHGETQDSKGRPLSAEAADALRDDVERFQSLLAMN
jgi:FtsZ-interacting cell division protein ZipA